MSSAISTVGIKESIQTILEAANTTTASTYLSDNLANSVKVKTIKKINPDKIPTQLSLYPLVTIYTEGRDVEHATISRNQSTGKRKTEIDFKVMGLVFNNNISVNDEDPADEDIEYLMDNIEQIIRDTPKFNNSSVQTSIPESIEYHRGRFLEDERTHLRAGILTLKVTAFY